MGRIRNYRKAMAGELLAKYGGGCAYCGVGLDATTVQVDHVDPSGPDCADNYLPCCKSCNATKGRKSLTEFRAYCQSFGALEVVPDDMGFTSRQLGWLLEQSWFPVERAPFTFPFERFGGDGE